MPKSIEMLGDNHTSHSVELLPEKQPSYLEDFKGMPDKEVWKAFQKNQEKAFIYIYQQNFARLFQYGSQFTANRELIKDCIQDLFIELNEKKEKLQICTSIKLYLFKSLKNKIVAALKKQKKFSLRDDLSKGFNFQFDLSVEHTLINHQIDQEKKQELHKALQQLTTRQREIIYYYFHEGLSYREIKDLMNMEMIKSAQNLLYKTIKILRQQIPYLLLLFISKILQFLS